jgi:hypothetical protein
MTCIRNAKGLCQHSPTRLYNDVQGEMLIQRKLDGTKETKKQSEKPQKERDNGKN